MTRRFIRRKFAMTRYEEISILAEDTARRIVKNGREWTLYLDTAARLYKYPFSEQMLIYAQRPGATACALMEDWNEKMYCWVNRYSKGIGLPDTRSAKPKLKYVFDIADVHRLKNGRYPYLWEMREEVKEPVLARLESIYGATDENRTFEERIVEIAGRIAGETYAEILNQIGYVTDGSYLEGLDEMNLGVRLRETLASSIAYTVLSRCGADRKRWREELDFDHISEFNTVKTLSILGNATTEMCRPLLIEIKRAIRAYERQNVRNRGERESIINHQKNIGKGIASSQKEGYNTLKRESESKRQATVITETDQEKEGKAYESDIREERGLSDTEPVTQQGAGGGTDQIRADAEKLSEGTPGRDLSGHDTDGRTEGTLSGGAEAGRGADGLSDSADGENGGRDGGDESVRPDEVGGDDEQHQTLGGGDRAGGTDLHLDSAAQQNRETGKPDNEHSSMGDSLSGFSAPKVIYEQLSLFPTLEEQIGTIAAAQAGERYTIPAAFSLPEEQLEAILRTGGGRNNSRSRIYAKYRQGKTPEEMEEFLKKEYGTVGKGFYFDSHPVSVWFCGMGMCIGYGMSAKENTVAVMGWQEVEGVVRSMVENGTYMSANEVFLVDAVVRQRVSDVLYNFFWDGIGEVPESIPIKIYDHSESMAKLGELLSTQEGREVVTGELLRVKEQLDTGEKRLKRRYVESLGYLLSEMADLSAKKRVFPVWNHVEVLQEDFITQDEIDYYLTGENRVHFRQFRIYEYFMEGHDKKENIAFLKKEYGIGGGCPALTGSDRSDEWHDAKGILLRKGRITDPYATVLLKWNVVEKRIGNLIRADKYLTAEGKEAYVQYKKEQAEETMRREWESQEHDKCVECRKAIEKVVLEKSDGGQLTEETAGSIIREYGIDRVRYVLSHTVFHNAQDQAVSDENKEWAKEIVTDSSWRNHDLLISSRCLALNDFINQTRQYIERDKEKAVEQTEPEKMEKSEGVNFRIMDDTPGAGTAKEKYGWNVEAIRILEQIEKENRTATSEEQEVLSRYVGWGGLADAFDESKSAWSAEYQELKSLLSPEEYASARESTLNAHYTSPVIIQNIYETLERMGFEKGNILEPAMGIGNFFGCLPEKMRKSRLYGVELDGVTGRIARQLYPKADIKICGFEKTDYPDDFFDAAVGNVPFGQYKVVDKKYDRHNFLIHDYFFAKALDKVRPGGVTAFVTSKGTMDKKNPGVRKYLARRAELLGAVRLPNTAFSGAGTEVTSDILFLKKRDRVMEIEPDWVYLSENADGITMNDYFVQHPEMVVGRMEMVSGPYGMESTCMPDTTRPFAQQLREALSFIDGKIEAVELDELPEEMADSIIPADPDVKNYSYTLVDGKVYYRENSIMKPVDLSVSMQERIKGMVGIRNCTRELIRLQLAEYPDSDIREKQVQLNRLYDEFSKKYGLINSQTNKRAFNQDSGYCLLCSLEKLDEEGRFAGKADMFTKRTIKKAQVVTSVDTASEALAVSLSEKAGVNLAYMSQLADKSEEEITKELAGIIFQDPVTEKWVTADEYLSGNVREKLETAKVYAGNRPEYAVNVQALTQVQPKELDASEIEVRIGATWIEPGYIEDFMRDTFETSPYLFDRNMIGIQFSKVTGQWNVKGKNADSGNALVNATYGTGRRNAYTILEDLLNLKDSRVYDTIMEDGKEKRVLNKKETTLAAQKQEAIRETFKDWVFRDPKRRQDLVAKYNKLFNSTRPREYDGSHLKFPGMTPDIELKTHQKNAVAHVLYGDNTLLAHCVGAGKTFEMTAAAMESKRLGLCQKSLFVVPNHLTEQWASDFLRLYPGANILAATKKDFEPVNRKKFCSRISTGDYDAVIIGHSQFEKVPLSQERQAAVIERQIEEITLAIREAKAEKGERYTIKQMEKSKKALQARLKKLNDTTRKDDVVTFEQLGVDRLFVDESHGYKNLFLFTKMRNVAGITQTEAQKSSDMFAKCRYLDELTGGKGITFATGTPISNSMTELYTNMRYLQYNTLQRLGLGHFDSWAASFGETQTAIELSPEGTGYRAKTRFAKFFNLPELLALFKECADIQTADMLNLPVPEAAYENVVLKPSKYQQDMLTSLSDRAEAVRSREVDATDDNMLRITSDGRKLALDQRLLNPLLPDDENSKVNACVNRAYEIWEQTKEKRLTQLIFCDLSTPKAVGKTEVRMEGKKEETEIFDDVYHDIKRKLMAKDVPEEEIAFIHDANTETKKAELFGKVRSGRVRFLLGSTAKMGAGTNVQDRLIALHHIDVPWRPSDVGRILRTFKIKKNVEVTDNGKIII